MKNLNYVSSLLIGNPVSAFLMLLLTYFFSSCTEPRFYTPGSNPVPLFRYKGDIYTNVSGNIFNKYDGTVGYAFTNSLAAYAGAGRSSESSDNIVFKPEVPFYSSGSFQNYGLGYFLNRARSERLRFEAFADLCLGKYEITKYSSMAYQLNHAYWNATLSGRYQRIGLLFNIGSISRDAIFQWRYSARFSNLKFYDPVIVNEKYLYMEIARLNSKKDYYVLEHGLFARFGRGPVKFQVSWMFYLGLWAQSETNAVQRVNGTYIMSFIYMPNIFGKNRSSSYPHPQPAH